MLFNLLPIPPLDGSKLLRLILPDDLYHQIQIYSLPLLVLLLLGLQSTGLGDWLSQTVVSLTQFLLGI